MEVLVSLVKHRTGRVGRQSLLNASSLWVGCSLAAVLATSAMGASVTLAWNSSPSPGVTGYHLYVGVMSGQYIETNDVGNLTSAMVSDLLPGMTYFFAASAYNALNLESALSAEISYTVPLFPQHIAITPPATAISFNPGTCLPQLQLALNGQNQAVLTGTGPPGAAYDLLVCTNLGSWSVLSQVTMSPGGACQFVDTGVFSSNTPNRYYRLSPTVFNPARPESPVTP